jgi:hypothetical protein
MQADGRKGRKANFSERIMSLRFFYCLVFSHRFAAGGEEMQIKELKQRDRRLEFRKKGK